MEYNFEHTSVYVLTIGKLATTVANQGGKMMHFEKIHQGRKDKGLYRILNLKCSSCKPTDKTTNCQKDVKYIKWFSFILKKESHNPKI